MDPVASNTKFDNYEIVKNGEGIFKFSQKQRVPRIIKPLVKESKSKQT
jgi:hypothetical protein